MPWSFSCGAVGPAGFSNAIATGIINNVDLTNATFVESNIEVANPGQKLKRALIAVNYDDPVSGSWILWVGVNIHVVIATGATHPGHGYIYGWHGFQTATTPAQQAQIAGLPENLGHKPANTCPAYTPQGELPLDNDMDDQDDMSGGVVFAAPPPPPEAGPLKLKLPDSDSGKYNVPVTKHYTFNETGNIMIASTVDGSQAISDAAQDLFQEVSVFFAALTVAMSNTLRNPAQKPPYDSTDFYTLYDYAPMEAIIQKSGMFIAVNREDYLYEKDATSVTFNTELIASILGFAATDGADVAALAEVLRSMGKTATISWSKTGTYDKIGHLTFVCEYLLGMPLVSAEYYYIDEKDVQHVVHFGPCVNTKSVKTTLTIHKDTYMFVPPEWIRKYSGDLASVADTVEFQLLIKELESYVSGAPVVVAIKTTAAGQLEVTDGKLTHGTQYAIEGMNFGEPATGKPPLGKVYIGGVLQTVATGGWHNESIVFTAVNRHAGSAVGNVVVALDAPTNPSSQSAGIYKIT